MGWDGAADLSAGLLGGLSARSVEDPRGSPFSGYTSTSRTPFGSSASHPGPRGFFAFGRARVTGLWLNQVFDTAEDCRLLHALPKVLEALRGLSPDTWCSCLHVSTSPVPRAVGDVDDAILDKGLGPIGDFPLPQDLCFTRTACGTLTWRRVGRTGTRWSRGLPVGFPSR